jgi:hypothetical protein
MEKKDKGIRIYLNVPYKEKEKAKKLGARWDQGSKKWYIPKDMVMNRTVEVRELLNSWYEEPPIKTGHLKISANESKLLSKKLKSLLEVASALYNDKG